MFDKGNKMNWLINWLDSKIKFNKEKEEMSETNKMSQREIRELKERIHAMTPEELSIVADTIPVELCLGRIHNEILKAKSLEDSIKGMINKLEINN